MPRRAKEAELFFRALHELSTSGTLGIFIYKIKLDKNKNFWSSLVFL